MEAELCERIKTQFWPRLVRRIDAQNIKKACEDPKRPGETPKVLVPWNEPEQAKYYKACDDVETVILPEDKTTWGDYVPVPGILALAFKDKEPLSYPVPGGRFNEFYGWDSYFIALGLIHDGWYELASNVLSHFEFEIRHYGKILNANRPYFLTRSQPPFVTDLAWRLKPYISTKAFIEAIQWAIVEYNTVWTAEPRLDTATGLSKYHASPGGGIPPEVEPGHFDHIIEKYATQRNMSIQEYTNSYKEGRDPGFDEFLRHDKAVRESGHDVSSRFINVCADTASVDLNSFIYKYEVDIAKAVEEYPEAFKNESGHIWLERATKRQATMDKLMWDNNKKLYYDYNCSTGRRSDILSPTTLTPLWAGLATMERARELVPRALEKLEFPGGLASTEKKQFENSWQWDYPVGWAPHQILSWEGLVQYGFDEDAIRLADKWRNIILVSYKATGALYEKYDVVNIERAHQVLAEYGNQGSSETGFGWTNTSFVCYPVPK